MSLFRTAYDSHFCSDRSICNDGYGQRLRVTANLPQVRGTRTALSRARLAVIR